jgi:hypothetical protein
MRLVEVFTNPQGYRVGAGAVLPCYTPDKSQATAAWYHIPDHNFKLHIPLWYGTVIRNSCRLRNFVFKQLIADYNCIIGLRGGQLVLCRCRLPEVHVPRVFLQVQFCHNPMCGDAPDLILSTS